MERGENDKDLQVLRKLSTKGPEDADDVISQQFTATQTKLDILLSSLRCIASQYAIVLSLSSTTPIVPCGEATETAVKTQRVTIVQPSELVNDFIKIAPWRSILFILAR